MSNSGEKEDKKVTKQLLKTISGEFDVESIHTIILSNADIGDLGCIGECAGLERLDLSHNNISKLYSLAGLTNLTSLNLSANCISSLEGLQSLDSLVTLNLAGNLINSTDTLYCITTLEKLTELRLKNSIKGLFNPICMNNAYKTEVIKMFPRLIVLDGERLSGKGSELFKLCEEMDKLIEKSKSSGDSTVDVDTLTKPWVQQDFWEHKEVTQFQETDFGNMEQQYDDLLAQCKQLLVETDEKIVKAKKDLPRQSAKENANTADQDIT